MDLKKTGYTRKLNKVDNLILYLLFGATAVTIAGIFISSFRLLWQLIAIFLLIFVGIIYFYFIIEERHRKHEEDLKARQSQLLLEITNETITDLKQGLNEKTAGKVARLIYEKLDAFAIAITDTKRILAYVGAGSDHHSPGKDILTKATQTAIKENKTNILRTRLEIGCPQLDCPLSSAIVIPLEINGQPVGTLKFYYQSNENISENNLTVAEGLARLLSTQLALAEVNRQAELTIQAELRALRAQINPHFLFNTLNTISVFCRTKPDEARKLLVQFADFFRKSLERNEEMVTVREELEYVHSYLLFEKARFGDKLKIIEKIDPLARQKYMPALILQPLVENAIIHGVTRKGTTQIIIRVTLGIESIDIMVSDNGLGISEEEKANIFKEGYGKGLGIGLYNINERLKAIYGHDFGMVIDSHPEKGTKVKFTIPIKEVEDVKSSYS